MLPECDPSPSREERIRRTRRFLTLAVVTAVVIVAAAWAGKPLPLRSPGRIALALLQGAATTVLIVAMARPMRHYDELQRRIQLEALALAFAGTAILATAYGFLVNAGLPDIDWGAWIWPGMVSLWAVSLIIANRRYR
jgi:multisubunit Na+/H+ antiporter MnhB subunit